MDWKKWSLFGAITGLFAWAVAYVINWLHIPVLKWGLSVGKYEVGGTFSTISFDVRNQIMTQGAFPKASEWFMNLFTNIKLTDTVTTIISLVVGGIVLLVVSAFVLSKIPGIKRLSGWKELLLVFAGAAVFGSVVFMGMTSLSFITSLITMVLYFVLIAGLILLVNKLTKGKFPAIPTL